MFTTNQLEPSQQPSFYDDGLEYYSEYELVAIANQANEMAQDFFAWFDYADMDREYLIIWEHVINHDDYYSVMKGIDEDSAEFWNQQMKLQDDRSRGAVQSIVENYYFQKLTN